MQRWSSVWNAIEQHTAAPSATNGTYHPLRQDSNEDEPHLTIEDFNPTPEALPANNSGRKSAEFLSVSVPLWLIENRHLPVSGIVPS